MEYTVDKTIFQNAAQFTNFATFNVLKCYLHYKKSVQFSIMFCNTVL